MKLAEPLFGRIARGLFEASFKKIIDKRLRDSYKYDPVVVDIVETEFDHDINYNEEYHKLDHNRTTRVCFRQVEDQYLHYFANHHTIDGVITHWRHINAEDVYVKHTVARYISTNGYGDFGTRDVQVLILDEASKDVIEEINRFSERYHGDLYDNSLYEYDLNQKRYVKKFDRGYYFVNADHNKSYYIIRDRSSMLLSQI